MMMLKNFECRYDDNYRVFRISWEGETQPADVRDMWIDLSKKIEVEADCKGFLVDQVAVDLSDIVESYKTVTDVFLEYEDAFKDRKIAVLVEDPKMMADFILMQRQSGGVLLRPFADENAALSWVLI